MDRWTSRQTASCPNLHPDSCWPIGEGTGGRDEHHGAAVRAKARGGSKPSCPSRPVSWVPPRAVQPTRDRVGAGGRRPGLSGRHSCPGPGRQGRCTLRPIVMITTSERARLPGFREERPQTSACVISLARRRKDAFVSVWTEFLSPKNRSPVPYEGGQCPLRMTAWPGGVMQPERRLHQETDHEVASSSSVTAAEPGGGGRLGRKEEDSVLHHLPPKGELTAPLHLVSTGQPCLPLNPSLNCSSLPSTTQP